jgi:hypothetical protein
MISISPAMYVDVGFCAILDEIEQYFGDDMVCVEDIIQIATENDTDFWSKGCLKIFKEIKKHAENESFTGDVIFYN